MRIRFFLLGVKVGNKNQFYGLTKVKKSMSADIKIGAYCTFRSYTTSNLIGINRPCILSALTKDATIEIGDYCGFSGTVIGAFDKIKIGNYVRCGANTLITDSDWHLDDNRAGKPNPVVIEDHVWIGEGVKILKGVTIGRNSVIGAGSVVTHNIEANVIAAGNPCVVKSKIESRLS